MKELEKFKGYFVTEDGRIWSERSQRFMTPSPNGKGYPHTVLRRSGANYKVYVHRLVAETYLPNPDNLPEVNHKNGNKTDNRVENLEWSTSSGNTLHAFANHLTTVVGSANPRAKYGEEYVHQVLTAWKAGVPRKELLLAFPLMSLADIKSLVNGQSWCKVSYQYGIIPRRWPRHEPFPEGVDTSKWQRGASLDPIPKLVCIDTIA